MIEFRQTYVSRTKLGFDTSAIPPGHWDRKPIPEISRVVSSLLVLGGKVLGIGVAGSMVTCCFVTVVWYWELVKSLADEIPIGKPTGEMVRYFSKDERAYSETAWSGWVSGQ